MLCNVTTGEDPDHSLLFDQTAEPYTSSTMKTITAETGTQCLLRSSYRSHGVQCSIQKENSKDIALSPIKVPLKVNSQSLGRLAPVRLQLQAPPSDVDSCNLSIMSSKDVCIPSSIDCSSTTAGQQNTPMEVLDSEI